MAIQQDEKIAIRAFARHIGVTDTYVQKQIFDEIKNPKGALRESICINENNLRRMLWKEMALTEWVSAGLTIKDKAVLAKLVPLIQQPQEALWEDETPMASTSVTNNVVAPVQHLQNKYDTRLRTEAGNVIHEGIGSYEAKALGEVFKAGKLELEYRVKLGKLVEKDAVYKTLFEFGQEVRTTMLQIPARIVSQLLACDTEREAKELLVQEIETALLLLARGPKNTTGEEDEQDADATA